VRGQFVDVIDLTPTVLDLIGVQAPAVFHGVEQLPLDGASIAATFKNPAAPDPRKLQYFEQGGNRAIWAEGWKAVAFHRPGTSFDADRWELYNLKADFSESQNLAEREPARLKQLVDLWWQEAKTRGVLPLDGRNFLEINAVYRARPGAINGRPSYTFRPGQEHLPMAAVPDTRDRSWSVSTEVNRPDRRSEGVILALGDPDGGFSFFIKDNRLVFDDNDLGRHTVLTSASELPTGKVTVSYRYTHNGPTGGVGRLYINGQPVAEAQIAHSTGRLTAWEGLDVGRDTLRPASAAYAERGEFALPDGVLGPVTLELAAPIPGERRAEGGR
jgi:arylsulfatase